MSKEYYPNINRVAVIVKLKEPFIEWLVYGSENVAEGQVLEGFSSVV